MDVEALLRVTVWLFGICALFLFLGTLKELIDAWKEGGVGYDKLREVYLQPLTKIAAVSVALGLLAGWYSADVQRADRVISYVPNRVIDWIKGWPNETVYVCEINDIYLSRVVLEDKPTDDVWVETKSGELIPASAIRVCEKVVYDKDGNVVD